MNDVEKRACAWVVGRDTGVSSKTLWSVMMGVEIAGDRRGHPHDPDDIGRCFRLLRHVPEWRASLSKMEAVSSEWAALVAHWDEIEQAFVREIGGLDPGWSSRAPYTYRLMREIMDAARSIAVKP